MQMICLTLIHGTPLPAPLSVLSPWIDWDVEPKSVVHERLAAQQHRRVIKTHTPLDGIPIHPSVRYIVVGRHPLDVAVSLFHHVGNIDQMRSAGLRGRPSIGEDRPAIGDWMEAWIDDRRSPVVELDTLAGNVHHICDAWGRQDDGNVLLVHFMDLLDHREATMRRIADWLGIDVPESAWPNLSDAVSFESMRFEPTATVPDHLGVLKDPASFFRSGSSGEGTELCSRAQLRRYNNRMSDLTTPNILAWLHRT